MSRRELIVSGPAGDPRVSEQMQALSADPDGARERELELIEREASAFQVELMGKDGGVKARWDNLVGVSELWAKIDATPTRRHALRRGLLTTGSTDFHGPDHGRFSAFCGFEVHGLTVELGPIGANTG